MTDYPVDNAQRISSVTDTTPAVGTPGRATSPDTGLVVSAPGVATTPSPSLTVSVPTRGSTSTPMTAQGS